MKRIFGAILVMGIALLTLAACGSSAPEPAGDERLFAANGPALTVVEKQPDQYTADPGCKTTPPEQSPDLLTMNSQEEAGYALFYPLLNETQFRELMQRAESWQNSLMADLKKKVSYADLRAEKLFAEMRHVLQGRVNAYRHELESCRLLLDENHPYRVLRKGYAVLEDAAGRNLASISDLRDGQSYRLKLKDGSATFRVTELAVTKEERNDDI